MSYITNNFRTKFGSFEEKMRLCLDKLKEADIFGVYLNEDGTLWSAGARGKTKFGVMAPEVAHIAMNILATITGTIIAEEQPFIEGEIPEYGHRFSGTIHGISRKPTFSIRKRASKLISLEEMSDKLTMQKDAIRIICEAINERKNIIIAGGPNSGKTTLANAILLKISQLDAQCRILTIEKVRELMVSSEDKESWEIPPALTNGEPHPVGITKLVELALRRDPGRFILGEVRNPDEAAGLLMFWNSGQPGGLATIHADSAIDALVKFEQYIDSSKIMRANPNLIARTVNIVISIQNIWLTDANGPFIARRIEEILQVEKYIPDTQRYHTTPLYRHIQEQEIQNGYFSN